ncbi:MAG: hypothetical protein ACFB9M_14530 [Myxococcota bacterium]
MAICPDSLANGGAKPMNAAQRRRHLWAWVLVGPVLALALGWSALHRDPDPATERDGWTQKERRGER